MERNFRNFADEEYTLFNINEHRNPEMTTKFNQERGYVGGLKKIKLSLKKCLKNYKATITKRQYH